MIKLLFLLFLPLCFACSEPDDVIRQKLEIILEDDLKAIVADLRAKDSSAVLEKPYYRMVSYESFQKKLTFNWKAVVEFYYLRSIKMMQVRKYRYNPTMRQWQRYDKTLEYNLS